MRDLFGLDCVITLYDLTNTYLEGRAEVNPQARHGHSKEKRADCPLAALALVLDGSGFVRRSEVFTSNAGEAQTLNEMLSGLDAPTGALVVMDRGIISQATIDWLAAPGYRYRVVSRTRRRHFDADAATPITTAGGERVHLQRVASADGRERYGYCHSEARARKEQAIEERFAQRFETELQRIHEGLSRPQTLKRTGRLKEKSRGIGQYYTIERVPEERGDKAIAVHWQRRTPPNNRAHYPGVYCFCAPMKRIGTASACGEPTSCSPTGRPFSARSNPNSACGRSSIKNSTVAPGIYSSPCSPISLSRSSGATYMNTASPKAGVVCASLWAVSAVSAPHSAAPTGAYCTYAKPLCPNPIKSRFTKRWASTRYRAVSGK